MLRLLKLEHLTSKLESQPLVNKCQILFIADDSVSKIVFHFLDVDIPDDGTNDPFDFKFVRWMTKEKVSDRNSTHPITVTSSFGCRTSDCSVHFLL